jgi:hypothetical protein
MKQSGVTMALVATLLVPATVPAGAAQAGSAADDQGWLPTGSWVRVEAPAVMEGRLTGRLVEQDADDLTIAIGDRLPLKVPRVAVTRAEVSLGRRKTVLPATLMGAGAGLILGLTVPLDETDLCGVDCTRSEMVGAQTFTWATVGALVGLLVKREDWRVIPTDSLKVSVAPTRGAGVAVGFTLEF